MYQNNTGGHNVATGNAALYMNTGGSYNTASGDSALYNNNGSTAWFNTATGAHSMFSNISGSRNTVIGAFALNNNISGNNNLALGDSAGYSSLGSNNIYIGHSAGANETGSNTFYIGNGPANTILYGDLTSRRILLGNANPTGFVFPGNRTLYVMGGILADSLRIALTGTWSDYVFENDYQLRPLSEVETFIRANRHLPDIPSADEVKEKGIELSAINAKLLAKVEELTLYVLAQQKQIDELKKQLNLKK